MLTEALYRFNGNPQKNRNTICHNSSLCKWDFIFPSVWRELHTVHIYIYYISVCVCACHWWRKNNHCSTGALKGDLCSTRTPKIKTELSTGNPWAPYGPMASKNFMHLEHLDLEAMALGVQTYRTINKIIQNHPKSSKPRNLQHQCAKKKHIGHHRPILAPGLFAYHVFQGIHQVSQVGSLLVHNLAANRRMGWIMKHSDKAKHANIPETLMCFLTCNHKSFRKPGGPLFCV